MITVLTTSGVYYNLNTTYESFTEGMLISDSIESTLVSGKKILLMRNNISAVVDGEV